MVGGAEKKKAKALRVSVRLTPKGGRDSVEGWMTGADGSRILKVRVAAIAEDGKANRALIGLLGKALGVPKAAVRIVSGETARNKIVEIEGDAATLAARLETLRKV